MSKQGVKNFLFIIFFLCVVCFIIVGFHHSVVQIEHKETYTDNTVVQELGTKPVHIKVGFMGDICFGTNFGKQNTFYSTFQKNGTKYFLDGMRPNIDEVDLRIANLENVFTDSLRYQPGKIYTYKAYTKDYIDILVDNKIDYVNVVNNHMTDYKQSGFNETLQLLEKRGIHYFGTNKKDSSNVEIGSIRVNKNQIFEKDGFKIGMMGYLGFNTSYPSKETIEENVNYFKSQNVDFIIASLHGGGQNTTAVTSKQIELAHQLIDLGADMVYGHHPHILQKTEIYKGKKIYYSLGNFLFIDYKGAKHPESVFVELDITRNENGNITIKYTDIPILWTGSEKRNTYRPTITIIPNRVEKVKKILSGQLSI